MSLLETIDADLKQAMRDKDKDKLGTLRMLKSAVKYAAIESGGADAQPSDEDVIVVLRKEVKKRQDSIESYNKGGRDDLAAKEEAEIKVLEAYLPQPLSAEEVEKIVDEAIAETSASTKKDMGKVMKAAGAKAAGRVDGKTLSQAVQKKLN